MQELNNILQKFDPITLDEMDSVKLMDRMDTKYVFNISSLNAVLEKMIAHYKLLEVNGVRRCRYENMYYDTHNFNFYQQHHNGKKNRYKIRFRNYIDSSLHYFEVKFSSNKGRTIKERTKVESIPDTIEGKAEKFLLKKTPFQSSDLLPLLRIYYTRMTFVSKTGAERVTIDTMLEFANAEKNKSFPTLVIAEAKQNRSCRSAFSEVMRDQRIRAGSISKYCFGMIQLYSQLKKNVFKPRLRTINQICHETE
ncbi:MAG: polyphosphate polymerase domain-containing protein [Bacteroidota bacterium]